MKKLAVLLAVMGLTFGIVGRVMAEPLTAELCKAKVVAAAKLITEKGEAAFAELKDPAGAFRFSDGEGYIWVHSKDNMMLMHPIKPELEGKSVADKRDVNGVYFFVNMTELAVDKGAGWVAYAWPKPGKQDSSPKVSYVMKAENGGKTYIVGSGLYDLTKDDIKKQFPGDPIAEE